MAAGSRNSAQYPPLRRAAALTGENILFLSEIVGYPLLSEQALTNSVSVGKDSWAG